MFLSENLELRQACLSILAQSDTAIKLNDLNRLKAALQSGLCDLDTDAVLTSAQPLPGRPAFPTLVNPRDVPKRSLNTTEGRVILLHAIAHIEFNAINLALDIIWRFPNMPDAFYTDWLQVACEEAYHFNLLCAHLQTLGYGYGDYLAHNGLWDMAERTQSDLLARLALVPRVLEARGLDVSPDIRDRLIQAGDHKAADILEIILRDEITHVACGNRWYHFVCQQHHVSPWATFLAYCRQYAAPKLHRPLNMAARLSAGFTQEELNQMLGEL